MYNWCGQGSGSSYTKLWLIDNFAKAKHEITMEKNIVGNCVNYSQIYPGDLEEWEEGMMIEKQPLESR